jgi:hypothetical protein
MCTGILILTNFTVWNFRKNTEVFLLAHIEKKILARKLNLHFTQTPFLRETA